MGGKLIKAPNDALEPIKRGLGPRKAGSVRSPVYFDSAYFPRGLRFLLGGVV